MMGDKLRLRKKYGRKETLLRRQGAFFFRLRVGEEIG